MSEDLHRRFEDFEWEGVPRQPYKEDGAAPFKAISRQVLFSEVLNGLRTALFRDGDRWALHLGAARAHARGDDSARAWARPGGRAGERGGAVYDLVRVPSWTWHQFRADAGEAMGFLCMVNRERDRPVLPSEEERAALRERVPEWG